MPMTLAMHLAVGSSGTILSSTDGSTWVRRNSGTNQQLKAVTWTGSHYVVLGAGGIILTAGAQPEFAPQILTQPQAQSLAAGAGASFSVAARGDPSPTYQWQKDGVTIPGATRDSIYLPAIQPDAGGNYSVLVANALGHTVSVNATLSVTSTLPVDLQKWDWRNPLPHGEPLHAVASEGGQFVAVGVNGTAMITSDGLVWTGRNTGVRGLLHLVRGGGQFVAVGYGGAIVTSPDGGEWTSRPFGQFNDLSSTTWSGSQFVAVGDRGTILTSPDGVAWTRRTSGTTSYLTSATWSGTQFVVVGSNQTVLTSPDGVVWTRRTISPFVWFDGVAWSGSRLVAVGSNGTILTSGDGINWTSAASGTTASLSGVTWNGISFVVTGSEGTLLTSPDGAVWTARNSGTTNQLSGAGWNGSQWMVVGASGVVLTSADGIAWNSRTSGQRTSLHAAASDGRQAVVVGDSGTLATSSDGVGWTSRASGTTQALRSVTWAGGQFWATGDEGTILASGDGVTWTPRVSGTKSRLSSLAWNGNAFVAVGEFGGALVSLNGMQWSTVITDVSSRYGMNAVTWGGGKFVAVGTAGTVLTSPDGVQWTPRPVRMNGPLYGIVWDGTQFIGVGYGGAVLASTDGVNWSSRLSGTTEWLYTVTWNGSQLVAVGAAGTVIASTDGVTWRRFETGTGNQLEGIAWTGRELVAVGGNGTILAANTFLSALAPTITRQPVAQSAAAGSNVVLTAGASGVPTPTFQWHKNGVAIAGATSATLSLVAVRPTDAGSYSVVATNAGGAVESAGVTLTVPTPAGTTLARLINVSILAPLAAGDDSITLGTVVGGSGTTGTKPMLVRAVGPSLRPLGVADALVNPQLEFYASGTKIGENDDWGGGTTLVNAFAGAGAFPYENPTSLDAALLAPALAAGNYSARVTGHGGAGLVLIELYDATAGTTFTAGTPRLLNVSVLKQIGSGFSVGFVVSGGAARRMLMRAIGPGLSAVGVAGGGVADPTLTLFSDGTLIALNDDWGGGPASIAAFSEVGAFQVPGNSRDAALVATLAPGNYTARVAGSPGQAGLVLVEVYEMP